MKKRETTSRFEKGFINTIKADLSQRWMLYLMIAPLIAYYIIFHYMPMYGAQIAFRDFLPSRGVLGSSWVGLKHFQSFFSGIFVGRLIRNTIVISFYMLVWGFPIPIIFALLLNEVHNSRFKRTVQTITYLPHFVSLVVMCGIIVSFTNRDGLINDLIEMFGGERISMLMFPEYFRPVYVVSGIWQEIGWNSIIYLAAIAGVNQELYEAATVDGAGRFRKMLNVTLPGIAPTIIILLILRFGQLMNVGFEKVLLLQNASNLETADVISTYVYRRGLENADYSFSAAVGLFNSVINFFMIVCANKFSSKVSETSLW